MADHFQCHTSSSYDFSDAPHMYAEYYALFLGGVGAAASTLLVVAIAKFRSYDKHRDKKQHARLVMIIFNFW